MPIEWKIFEIAVNVFQAGMIFYLLCSKFEAKVESKIKNALAFSVCTLIIAAYMSLTLFIDVSKLPANEIVFTIGVFISIIFFRKGKAIKKAFWTLLSMAIIMATSVLITALVAHIYIIDYSDILYSLSSARLITMILAQIVIATVCYILSIDKNEFNVIKNSSIIIVFIIPFLSVIILLGIYNEMYNSGNLLTTNKQVLITATGYLLINIIVFVLYRIISKEEKNNFLLQMKQQHNEMIQTHNESITEIYTQMRSWKHDYLNHMQVVVSLLENSEENDNNAAINYIRTLDDKLTISSMKVSTGNYYTDAIISSKIPHMEGSGIKFDYNVSLPTVLSIETTDFCSIVTNLLDNAIEACQKLECNRYISVELKVVKCQFIMRFVNSSNGKYISDGKYFKTTKEGKFHGIGLFNVDAIVNKYNGIKKTKACDDLFEIIISIPIDEKRYADD
jgi:Signal transduction histidine kinase regulating citrate/malate metabolism